MPNYYPQTDLSQQNYSWMIAKIKELEAMITGGGLKVVTLAADMTDHAIIYIYEGSESGMNPHHWYYWDTLSNAWTDGGYWGGTEVTFPISVAQGGTGGTTQLTAQTGLGLTALASAPPPLDATMGGTGQTSLKDARNAMGLGNTLSYLPIANGGTGQNTAAKARNAFGLGNTTGPVPVANGGTGASTAPAALANLGAQAVLTTVNPLAVTSGGTGASDAGTARTNLGLGVFATMASPIPVANGGTGATTESQARTNLVVMTNGTTALREVTNFNTVFNNMGEGDWSIYMGADSTNGPNTARGCLITFKAWTTFGWQMHISTSGYYWRKYLSGAWDASWTQIMA